MLSFLECEAFQTLCQADLKAGDTAPGLLAALKVMHWVRVRITVRVADRVRFRVRMKVRLRVRIRGLFGVRVGVRVTGFSPFRCAQDVTWQHIDWYPTWHVHQAVAGWL